MDSSVTLKLGDEALSLAEQLIEEYGEDVSVHNVCIVVDCTTERDGATINPIVFRCNDPRPWVQLALLNEAANRADERNEERIEAAHPSDDE